MDCWECEELITVKKAVRNDPELSISGGRVGVFRNQFLEHGVCLVGFFGVAGQRRPVVRHDAAAKNRADGGRNKAWQVERGKVICRLPAKACPSRAHLDHCCRRSHCCACQSPISPSSGWGPAPASGVRQHPAKLYDGHVTVSLAI